jgi:hypothetical protein
MDNASIGDHCSDTTALFSEQVNFGFVASLYCKLLCNSTFCWILVKSEKFNCIFRNN